MAAEKKLIRGGDSIKIGSVTVTKEEEIKTALLGRFLNRELSA
jgi:ribosomal protein L20A (L18A)